MVENQRNRCRFPTLDSAIFQSSKINLVSPEILLEKLEPDSSLFIILIFSSLLASKCQIVFLFLSLLISPSTESR